MKKKISQRRSPAPFPLQELKHHLQALRTVLDVSPLPAKERRSYNGKWFSWTPEFVARAAHLRERCAADLTDVPYDADDLHAANERVRGLAITQDLLTGLQREIGDTLLRERAALYEHAAAVLRTLEWARDRPSISHREHRRLTLAVKTLRFALDRRNQKVSQSKRAQPRALPAKKS